MKKLIKEMDKKLLFLVIVFAIFGLVMIFSASNIKASVSYDNPYYFFIRQGVFLVSGIVIFLIVVSIPTKVYAKYKKYLIVLTVLILVLTLTVGVEVRGARSWLGYGIFRIQPGEFAKMAVIIYMAVSFESLIKQKKVDLSNIFMKLTPVVLVAGLIFLQPDYGTALIIVGIAGLIFLAVPIKKHFKFKIFGAAIIGVLCLVGILFAAGRTDTMMEKLKRFNFLNPCSRYTEASGYQVCNGFIAINGGGIFGKGLGRSTQKYLYLPEAYNDFIYPIIVEETGMIIGSAVIIFYIYLIGRAFKVSRKAYTLRDSLIAYGIGAFFLIQVGTNLVGVLGLLPLTGVSLPFLSYGGSMLWTSIIAVALLERVIIENNLNEKKNILRVK